MARMVDPRRDAEPMRPGRQQQAHARRIAAELARLGFALPGSVTSRYTRCHRSGCRCMADPPQPHGPYWWWTRKANAKTVTQVLTADQYEDYRPWFDNARRARELLAELETLSLTIVETDPRSARRPRGRRPKPAPATNDPVDKPRSRRR